MRGKALKLVLTFVLTVLVIAAVTDNLPTGEPDREEWLRRERYRVDREYLDKWHEGYFEDSPTHAEYVKRHGTPAK